MRRSTDDRGISREKTGGIPPSLTSRGRGRSGQASVPLSGVPLPSGTFTAMGGRRRGFPTFLSAGARRGVGGWAAGALMFAVGLLLSASPAAALTKAYKYREDVAVIANNVSSGVSVGGYIQYSRCAFFFFRWHHTAQTSFFCPCEYLVV